MADATRSDLDDFLGAKPPTRLERWGKWIAVAVGVVLLALLARHFLVGSDAVE